MSIIAVIKSILAVIFSVLGIFWYGKIKGKNEEKSNVQNETLKSIKTARKIDQSVDDLTDSEVDSFLRQFARKRDVPRR